MKPSIINEAFVSPGWTLPVRTMVFFVFSGGKDYVECSEAKIWLKSTWLALDVTIRKGMSTPLKEWHMGVASFVCFKISGSDLIYLMNLTNRENV